MRRLSNRFVALIQLLTLLLADCQFVSPGEVLVSRRFE